ncbi:hypothetical protein B0O80DRAFT_256329 [Mortierella sp. GBAus27b]|nr:hypothetical protein B0O80DRAFT_256329 [Mortierella sp. GBAus27b]
MSSVFGKYRYSTQTPTVEGLTDDLDSTEKGFIRDIHIIPRFQSSNTMVVTNRVIHTLRDGFLGYFGRRDGAKTVYSAEIDVRPATLGNLTIQDFWVEVREVIDETETLVVPIQAAIASFGGIFSLISSVLILLYGAGRIAPFGFVQRWFMNAGTRERMNTIYGTWKQGDGTANTAGTADDKEKQVDPFSSEKQMESSSSETPLDGNISDLREQVRVHETRFKELETLLKTFYLDMGLVNTDDYKPNTVSIV